MTTSRGRLLVFAREPRPGRVKTRLIPLLGASGATALYERLLGDTLAAASGVGNVTAELWCDSGGVEPRKCRALAGRYGMALHPQRGEDLGTRMYHALASIPPAAGQPAVLVGSDCPDCTAGYLADALAALRTHDAVLGPALDGGYVLLGLRRLDPQLFDGIPWGTGDVLRLTRTRLGRLGWAWRELPALRDLDRPSDLAHFPGLSPALGPE